MEKETFSQALPTGYRLGDYVIDRALRQGGFGVTYIAHVKDDEERVVIKENLPAGIACREASSREVVPFHATEEGEVHDFEWALNNFYKEAKLLASLDHPNIVKVLRAFHALGTAYYVMPYVGGESLDQWGKQNGRPDGATIIRLMRSMLSALDYMHRHNILHRDVKPSNIIMQEDGEPVLIDFGTARHIISERSATKVCSPGYTPFEQMQVHGVCGPWTDLYALGATFYTLITGKRPPESTDRTARPKLMRPLTSIPVLVGIYGKPLLACIDKALRMPIDERWQSAEEWADALDAVTLPKDRNFPGMDVDISDVLLDPITIEDSKLPPSVRKKRRRRRRLILAISCIVLLALCAAGACLFLPQKEQPTAQPAEQPAAQPEEQPEEQPAVAPETPHGVNARSHNLFIDCYTSESRPVKEAEVREAAEDGDAEAQNDMGNVYKGRRQYALAVQWYRKAAAQGHALAQNNLAICYMFGRGIEQDEDEAARFFLESAKQGYGNAQFNYGSCCVFGHGVPKDMDEAVQWFRLAAEQDNADAQYAMGVCYAEGITVDEDKEEAVKWYLKAAEQGNDKAQNALGECYEYGTGVQKDVEEAIKWYRQAADRQNALACSNLGACYEFSCGTAPDMKEAAKWYRMAAERGVGTAQYNLGVCYEHGLGVPKSGSTALKWYRKAAEQGLDEAEDAVLRLEEDEEEGQPHGSDCKRRAGLVCGFIDRPVQERGAGDAIREAAERGDADACMSMGAECSARRQKVQAFTWYRKAAELGSAAAQNTLGMCYLAGEGTVKDKTAAATWFRKAAEQGDAMGQHNYATCLYFGVGVPEDEEGCTSWYIKAAEQGEASAQYNLGVCCEEGIGVEQDPAEALRWYKLAAEGGNGDAQNALGICYFFGHGVDKDEEEAVKWFQKAVAERNINACLNLGTCYEFGRGVKQNWVEAAKLYKTAAENGCGSAQYNLGVCYEYGLGVRRNKGIALKWYRKAEENGEQEAADAILRLEP